MTAEEKAAFARWYAECPDHRREFERLQHSWQRLEKLGALPQLHAEAEAILVRARRSRWSGGWRISAWGAAAAAVIVLAFFGLRPEPPVGPPQESYRVLASTSHDVLLPDGTTVQLNGDSRMEAEFTADRRWVRLEGEALFKVMKDPSRPFFVSAGPVTVRAVGTAFNVRIEDRAIRVLVTEGKVRLTENTHGRSLLPAEAQSSAESSLATPESKEEPLLVAGQHALVDLAESQPSAATVTAFAPYEIEQVLAWQSTQLVFSNTPLDEVVAAFNQYNRRKLKLSQPSLASQRITGVFRADNVEGFIRLLELGADVRAFPQDATLSLLAPAN